MAQTDRTRSRARLSADNDNGTPWFDRLVDDHPRLESFVNCLPFIGCIIAMLLLFTIGGVFGVAAAYTSAWTMLLYAAAEVLLICLINRSLGHFANWALDGIMFFCMTVSMLCVFGIIRLGGL